MDRADDVSNLVMRALHASGRGCDCAECVSNRKMHQTVMRDLKNKVTEDICDTMHMVYQLADDGGDAIDIAYAGAEAAFQVLVILQAAYSRDVGGRYPTIAEIAARCFERMNKRMGMENEKEQKTIEAVRKFAAKRGTPPMIRVKRKD